MEATDQVKAPAEAPLIAALLIGALLAFSAAFSTAHPSHASYAEIERDGDVFNVALSVTPEDLERALGLLAGASVTLVDTPEVRALLTTYLAEHFLLRDKRGESNAATASIDLVGMELGYRDTWIYFTIDGSGISEPLLTNTLLMDLEATQTNRVKRLWAPDAPTLLFTASEPERALEVLVP